ncbi:hypothetical protein HUW63_31695 [Myxococcus sp. AM001]|nr:hypothetical protein [Myxococcus sp. AM001]
MRADALLLYVALLASGCAGLNVSERMGSGPLHQTGTPVPLLPGKEDVGSTRRLPLPGAEEEASLRRGRTERGMPTRSHAASVPEATSGTPAQADAFEALLARAGLGDASLLPRRAQQLTPATAARLLNRLMERPVTLGNFPSRMAAGHLLREVLERGEVSRAELLRRVQRFGSVAVLRSDGYLAWTLSGRTQQRVTHVEWKGGAFRAHGFELGRFYDGRTGVFRLLDATLHEETGFPLTDVHHDADYVSRTLDGAEEAFLELALAMGQLFSTPPGETLAALGNLPSAVAALIAASPAYLERFRHMTHGEQVKAVSKLATSLLATWGTASVASRTLGGAMAGLEGSVPVLTLSAEGALVLERVAVPVGHAAAVLSGGPGAAIILQRANTAAQGAGPSNGPGQWGPSKESMSPRARRYQEQISGHSADEAYWVGNVKFDGFENGVLLEAKGPGYANKFLDNLKPKVWFEASGAKALVEQALRQRRAATGTGSAIRWHVAEQKTADAVRGLLRGRGITEIDVIFTPPLP